jgi:hypothetical protein
VDTAWISCGFLGEGLPFGHAGLPFSHPPAVEKAAVAVGRRLAALRRLAPSRCPAVERPVTKGSCVRAPGVWRRGQRSDAEPPSAPIPGPPGPRLEDLCRCGAMSTDRCCHSARIARIGRNRATLALHQGGSHLAGSVCVTWNHIHYALPQTLPLKPPRSASPAPSRPESPPRRRLAPAALPLPPCTPPPLAAAPAVGDTPPRLAAPCMDVTSIHPELPAEPLRPRSPRCQRGL